MFFQRDVIYEISFFRPILWIHNVDCLLKQPMKPFWMLVLIQKPYVAVELVFLLAHAFRNQKKHGFMKKSRVVALVLLGNLDFLH